MLHVALFFWDLKKLQIIMIINKNILLMPTHSELQNNYKRAQRAASLTRARSTPFFGCALRAARGFELNWGVFRFVQNFTFLGHVAHSRHDVFFYFF